jgi:hypothetical protein
MKVPATLDELLTLMRARGVQQFDIDRADVGKLSISLARPDPVGLKAWLPDANTTLGTGIHASLNRDATPTDATAKEAKISSIELALNPPTLDVDSEEVVDPETVLAPDAPREKVPAGASDPDADE